MGMEDEMWFLIGGKLVRFSLYEFGLITGLCIGKVRQRVPWGPLRLRDTYLGGENVKIPKLDRMLYRLDYTQMPDEDAVKLALFYFVERFLICSVRKWCISLDYLRMVDHIDIFNAYPWGSECYDKMYECLSKALKDRKTKFDLRKTDKNGFHEGEKYELFGCPYAFLIWLFEAIPFIGSLYAISRDGLVLSSGLTLVPSPSQHPIMFWMDDEGSARE